MMPIGVPKVNSSVYATLGDWAMQDKAEVVQLRGVWLSAPTTVHILRTVYLNCICSIDVINVPRVTPDRSAALSIRVVERL